MREKEKKRNENKPKSEKGKDSYSDGLKFITRSSSPFLFSYLSLWSDTAYNHNHSDDDDDDDAFFSRPSSLQLEPTRLRK